MTAAYGEEKGIIADESNAGRRLARASSLQERHEKGRKIMTAAYEGWTCGRRETLQCWTPARPKAEDVFASMFFEI
jgi:hypothetical protein